MASLAGKIISASALAGLLLPHNAEARTDPYVTVIAATAVNVCLVRHGYATTDEAVEYLMDYTSKKGISPYQVNNIMELPNFWESTKKAIEGQGGCSNIMAKIMQKSKKTTRSLAAGPKFDTDSLYNEALEIQPANPYNPNFKKYIK